MASKKPSALQAALQAREALENETGGGQVTPGPARDPEPAPVPVEAAKPGRRFSTTVYPDRAFYDQIRIALIREGRHRDFNRLVMDLLREWMEKT